MRYLLMFCYDEAIDLGPEVGQLPDHRAWVAEVRRRGTFLAGDRLRPTSDATTVRAADGEVLVSDGPYVETKEQIGGFTLIDCPDLDVAIELAGAHPLAALGRVEVRPIWP